MKEKKYFQQIENYNKKIDNVKGEIAKLQQSVSVLKKQNKMYDTVIRLSFRQLPV